MTELISGFPHPQLGRSPYDSMPDSADEHWQQHLIDQMPLVAAQWVQQQQGPQVTSAMHDYNVYAHDGHGYGHPHYSHGHPSLVSPNLGYPSDMDTAGTPSTPGYGEADHPYAQPPSNLLRPPQHRLSGSTHSPHSSHGHASPRAAPSPQLTHLTTRPGMQGRAVTDPTANELPSKRSSYAGSGLKHSDEDEDDDYKPSEPSNRGRKRQRIPHTAVERRYRENLNAHLDKLRMTVPSLARRGADGTKGEGGQGVKPSKCEVLNGAIEHIGAQNKEIADLKAENATLRARVDQMQNWYRANSR